MSCIKMQPLLMNVYQLLYMLKLYTLLWGKNETQLRFKNNDT